jgi:hypothetical protein
VLESARIKVEFLRYESAVEILMLQLERSHNENGFYLVKGAVKPKVAYRFYVFFKETTVYLA